MQPQYCSIHGCVRTVQARYSHYCQNHRQRLRRYGHPLQSTIYPRDLAPHVKLLATRQRDNASSKAYDILRSRWSAMVDRALSVIRDADAGHPYSRPGLASARLIQGISGNASADTVAQTCMAVVMLSRSEPRRFVADRTVPFALARLAMRLDPSSAGRYYCHETKRSKTVRRDVAPRVLEVLGGQLLEAFGGPAAQLWAIEQARVPPAEQEQRELASALEALRA